MKIQTNRDIFIKLFWEHVQFGYRSQEFMVNRSVGYRFYRGWVAELTQKSIGMMANPQEQSQAQKLLEAIYGADLVMSEADLDFPSDPTIGDLESWKPAFDKLRALYGTEVGVSRRTGKDLRKYKPNDALQRNVLRFLRMDEYRFRAAALDAKLDMVVHFQEFPREHLYRLESGQQTILEFDDWPPPWSRDW